MSDELEARLDALEAWQDAAVTKMKRLGEENERLRDRVAELEELVDPDPGGVAYEQLTSDQKVHRIRVALLEQATAGKAPTMKYDDVRWLFDGKPSAGHASSALRRASSSSLMRHLPATLFDVAAVRTFFRPVGKDSCRKTPAPAGDTTIDGWCICCVVHESTF